ncbi:hypothetical protein [Plantibacter sp.]
MTSWPVLVGIGGTLAIAAICAALIAMGLVRPNTIVAAGYC